mgnify:CR=1 FL=1
MALLCGKSDVGFRDSRVLICPKSAPIAVSKTDNVKIITPEANQFADAWDIDYRKYQEGCYRGFPGRVIVRKQAGRRNSAALILKGGYHAYNR